MKKNLINEINRISELMGGKPLLFEQAIPKILKPLLNLGDDVIKSFMKNFDSEVDDAVRVIKNADETTARNVVDDAVEVLVRNIDFPKLVNIMLDQKMLGSAWDSEIDKIITFLKANPEKEAEILAKLDGKIDGLPMLEGAPPELVTQIKLQTKRKIKDGLPKSSAGASAADNIADEFDDIFKQYFESNMDDILSGTKSVDSVLSEFLTTNGKKLSQFYNPAELADYLTQLKGALSQVSDKLMADFGADVSKVWNKMTLAQQREFAKKAIEEITKKVPFGYKDLFNVKKLTTYVLKGADNEFSVKLFLKRIVNIWKMSIGVQLVGLIMKGINITAEQRKGYELTWEDKVNYIMQGRSMQEVVFDILVPFVSWAADIVAAFDTDTTFDELKSQLPITVRDNIFRNKVGEGYFIKQAGVSYPLELHNNQWEIQIDGQWYKLSDVDF